MSGVACQVSHVTCNFQRIGPLADSFYRVTMSVVVCVRVFVPFHVLDFEAYFAPSSRSRMSNIFRYSEFLGKSDGKKWSQN